MYNTIIDNIYIYIFFFSFLVFLLCMQDQGVILPMKYVQEVYLGGLGDGGCVCECTVLETSCRQPQQTLHT